MEESVNQRGPGRWTLTIFFSWLGRDVICRILASRHRFIRTNVSGIAVKKALSAHLINPLLSVSVVKE